jgi:hypothetical protein
MVLKRHLTPIGKGPIIKHQGKGARPFPPQPKPGALTQGAPSTNNYAKQTPLPTPPPPATPSIGGAPMQPGDPSAGQDQGMV